MRNNGLTLGLIGDQDPSEIYAASGLTPESQGTTSESCIAEHKDLFAELPKLPFACTVFRRITLRFNHLRILLLKCSLPLRGITQTTTPRTIYVLQNFPQCIGCTFC